MLIKLKINNNMEEYKKENWKPINGYEGLYEISDLGRVKSLRRKKNNKPLIFSNCKNSNGYNAVNLRKDNKIKRFTIHRLVALNFLENNENKPDVNHIDGNKNNNELNNLEWCTKSENQQHRRNVLKKNNIKTKKTIYKYDLNDNLINKYQSIKEAARKNNCSDSDIIKCAKGINHHKTVAGYKWKYELI